ncbi:hypothetical protein A3F03_04390 [Candidatus Roizmanbacteria bacterium RIFCSPHIGHO2_12_FULL_41_11]|uniref:Peptidase M16 n=2 Tax=Candidatus Roizmaniibacteriota TaxID=1752723 RepID=A0A1F7J988_9BACT|nr:MAG: hypothetical protein A3F03_04390 [Candidatus Roizmanbacteria bacterium RIFCSPHIGHO2_12_FULL_41_11]OGK52163.1 MAG: hypothetical protein A2966_02060 [Candidatus Roizmanbacteria bacterium RIFCSPLOWO2_01_FULL_41_22]
MTTKSVTLPNGLRVILIDTDSFPTLTTLLLIGAGSRYENANNNGIAHFLEHMAFKGSKKYPSSFIISSTIESMGGVFNAFTAKDHTGYWIKSTVGNFPRVVDVLADMVVAPLLDPLEINREKGVITEEINMYEDMPARKVGDYYEELLYQGTTLGFDVAGTKQTISQFKKQTFVDYMSQLYHSSNAVLVVAGGLGHWSDHYLKLIEQKFAHWPSGPKNRISEVAESQTKPQIAVHYKKTEQSHFCFGFRAFSFRDPRRYALSILTTILGGGMSSRLFMEVRERRGLCYYISTGRELYADVGHLVTQAGVRNNLPKIKEAIKVIWDEHQKIADGQFKQDEMAKAKEMIKGRMLLSLEDSSAVASFYGTRQLMEGDSITPDEVIAKIASVTKEEIVGVARELFCREKLNIALIGPYKKEDLKLIFNF